MSKTYWVRDSSGMDWDIEADHLDYYPSGGEFDANTLVIDLLKNGKTVASFAKPICCVDRSCLETNKQKENNNV